MREAAEEVGGVGGGHSMQRERKFHREGRRLYQGYPQKGLFSMKTRVRVTMECRDSVTAKKLMTVLSRQQNVSQRPEIHF